MRISMKGVYAVRAMVDLAVQSQNYPVTLANISVRQDISQHYLEQLFMKLRRAKLVRSVRGPGGGYLLSKRPEEISVWDILVAVDENLIPADCGEAAYDEVNSCHRVSNCAVRGLFMELSANIHAFLGKVSLASLCDENNRLGRDNIVRHGVVFQI